MRNRRLLLPWLLLLNWHFLFGVTIHGIVRDEKTDRPLLGVNVEVVGAKEGAVTDARGVFQLELDHPLPVELRVTHIGYKPQEVEVTQDTVFIYLAPAVLKISEVEVLGIRSKTERDVAASIERLEAEEITLEGARDVGSALRRLSSVELNLTSTGRQTVSIRGSNATDVAVFLDGIRLNDANTGIADLSYVDLNAIDQIQVIKGGAATLFGAGGIGGVVNLKSREAVKNSVYYTQGEGLSFKDDLDISFGATGVLGPLGLGGRYTGKTRAYAGRTVTTTLFENLFGGVNIFSGRADARWYRFAKTLTYPSGGVSAADGMTLLSLGYKGPLGKTRQWDFSLGLRQWYMNQDFFTSLNEDLEDGTQLVQVAKGFNWGALETTFQMEAENNYFKGDRSYLDVVGNIVKKQAIDLERDTRSGVVVVRWVSPDQHPNIEHLNWELGLRANRINTSQDEEQQYPRASTVDSLFLILPRREQNLTIFSKRLGVYVDGKKDNLRYAFFANQGRNTRLPTLSDEFHFTHLGVDSLADSVLTREYLTATEVNGEITLTNPPTTLPINEVYFSLGLFINDFTNKIAYRQVDDLPPIPYNVPLADIRGQEATLRLKFMDSHVVLTTNATWLQISDMVVFPNKPESRYVLTGELHWKWLVISYDHVSEGEYYYYIPGIGDGVRKKRENANLNLTLRKRWLGLQWTLAYTLRNLLSREEQDLTWEESLRQGFNYFEKYREIITLKVEL